MSIRHEVGRGRHGRRRGWVSALAFEFEHLESRRLLSGAIASTVDTALFCQGPIVNGCLVQGATGQDYFPDDTGPALDDTGSTDSSDDGGDDVGDVIESDWIDVQDPTSVIASRDGHIAAALGQFQGKLAPGEYTVTIDWGDDTQSAGQVVANSDGSYSIIGAHDYAAKGQYDITVDVTGSDNSEGGSFASALAHADTLTVTESPDLSYWTGKLPDWMTDFAQDDSSSYIGSFYDIDQPSGDHTGGDGSAYTVTIDWGDGTQSAGTVSQGWDGGYDVFAADHAYAAPGTFNVSFTASRADHSATVTAVGTAEATDASTVDWPDGPIMWVTEPWLRDGVQVVQLAATSGRSGASTSEHGAQPALQAPARSTSLFAPGAQAPSIAQQVFKSDQNVKDLSDGPAEPLS